LCASTPFHLVKGKLQIDDSLDVFAVHGVGGIMGSILLAILASEAIGGNGYAEGMTMGSQLLGAAQGRWHCCGLFGGRDPDCRLYGFDGPADAGQRRSGTRRARYLQPWRTRLGHGLSVANALSKNTSVSEVEKSARSLGVSTSSTNGADVI
jgi:hypothetical protein